MIPPPILLSCLDLVSMHLLKLSFSWLLHTHRLIQLPLQSHHHHDWPTSISKNTQMHGQMQRKSMPTICEGNLQWGWVRLNGILCPEWPGRNKSKHTLSWPLFRRPLSALPETRAEKEHWHFLLTYCSHSIRSHTEHPENGAGGEQSKREKLIDYVVSGVRNSLWITLHDKKWDYVNETRKAWKHREMGKKKEVRHRFLFCSGW